MAGSKELLEQLATQEAEIKVADLASQVNSNVESVRKQVKRLKNKGFVTASGDGWLITDAGREALDSGEFPGPSMMDEKLTPYDAFSEIGKRIGLSEDRVKLAADMVFAGDYEDLRWVWDALGQQRLRNDIRNVYFNNWRVQVRKPVPEEIAEEVFALERGSEEGGEGKGEGRRKKEERDYILVDDMPVRVGVGLGDFDLQTAKEMAGLRALKTRFGQPAATGAAQPAGPVDSLSELITALAAFREKPDQQNVNALLKELQDSKFDNLKQEISSQLSRIPQPQQQKSFMEQLTDVFASLGSLRDMGPTIRGILGVPEPRQEGQPTGTPIQLTDKDGNPMVMDINSLISWRRFDGEERRADERHEQMKDLVKTVREVLPDGVAAIKDTASQLRGSTKASVPGQAQGGGQAAQFQCPHCSQTFTPDLSKDIVKCPNPECSAEWDSKSLVKG